VHPQPPSLVADYWRSDQLAVRTAATEEDVDVVAGDLNATPDHASLVGLAADGFRSAAEVANQGWQPTWPAFGSRRVLGLPLPPVVRIDHVLVGLRVAALGTETVAVDGSDHLAVVAELALR